MRANKRMDERVAQYFSLYFWLSWPTVRWGNDLAQEIKFLFQPNLLLTEEGKWRVLKTAACFLACHSIGQGAILFGFWAAAPKGAMSYRIGEFCASVRPPKARP